MTANPATVTRAKDGRGCFFAVDRRAWRLSPILLLALTGLTGGCDLILGIPNLGDPGNVAAMKARFKAVVQAQLHEPMPLDWGEADRNIRLHYMGPGGVEVCGRPVNAALAKRYYQINFYRGSFGAIDEWQIDTPAHPLPVQENPYCAPANDP